MRKRALLKTATVGAILVASLLDVHAATTTTFREGVNGYAGTQDTFISSGGPTTDNGADTTIEIDQAGDAGEFLLLRFENIFGTGASQVPPKSKILFASLTVQITNTGNEPKIHRMLVPWKESDTWETLVDGILADDVEAAAVEDVTFPGNGSLTVIPLLVDTLQAWSDGTKPNHGWVILPGGTDGTDFSSSEHSNPENRPLLTIVWGTVDEPYVKSVSPLNGATGVPVDSNIQLIVVDGKVPQLNPNSVQLVVNGQSVKPTLDKPVDSNETTILYDPPTNLPQSSKIPVRLIYADTATPPHVSTNDFSFTTRATTVTLFAIDDKQLWRYDRSGTDLGTTWKEKTFNDSAWPEGPALIGQEGGATAEPLRTPIERYNDLGDYVQTFYFRTHFNYAGPLGGDLFLRHVIDDGAVFYLNGVELHRFGLAPGAAFDFSTSFGGHENAYEGPFVIPGTALVTGDNVFAAEVHQSGTSSSDVVFGAELLVSTSPSTPVVTPPPTGGTLDVRVAGGLDDSEEHLTEANAIDITSSDLELGAEGGTGDTQAIGIRFRNINIPAGSTITSATIQFTVDEADDEPTSVLIYGELSTNPIEYSTVAGDITGRKKTAASVAWNNIPIWSDASIGAAGPDQRTPDLSSIVRELIGQPGWTANNAMAFIIMPNPGGERTAEAFEGDAAATPLLHIEYKAPSATTGPTMSLARTTAGLTLTFTGTLQSADSVTGPWTDVANAASPLSVSVTGARKFYRAKQ